jgi:hypothetical protein
MDLQGKINFLYGVYKDRKNGLIGGNTHLAMCALDDVMKLFRFYGPEVMWSTRPDEYETVYAKVMLAHTWVNDWGDVGFTYKEDNLLALLG